MDKLIFELEQALRDKSLRKQEHIRIQAVLMKKRGLKRKEISKLVGRSFDSVENWIMAYNKNGLAGLMTKEVENVNSTKLTYAQKDYIKEILTKQTPDKLGLSSQDYWDVPALRELVKKEFDVEYKSHSSYILLLKYCGYSYQRIAFEDLRKDPKSSDDFKIRFKGKLKKGGNIVMSW